MILRPSVPLKYHGRYCVIYSIGIKSKRALSPATSAPKLIQHAHARPMTLLPPMTTTMTMTMKTTTMNSTKNIPKIRPAIHPTNTTKMPKRRRCQPTRSNRPGRIEVNAKNAKQTFQKWEYGLDRLTRMLERMDGGFIWIVGVFR